jgi:hypothetical protein
MFRPSKKPSRGTVPLKNRPFIHYLPERRRAAWLAPATWRSMTKIAGSGSECGFGSISQRHGSEYPDPAPLVRGMDPRLRIHTKMSWIRNTDVSTCVAGSGDMARSTIQIRIFRIHMFLGPPRSGSTSRRCGSGSFYHGSGTLIHHLSARRRAAWPTPATWPAPRSESGSGSTESTCFWASPDPDPLVRGVDPDPNPSIMDPNPSIMDPDPSSIMDPAEH